jgi:hypothetical protein
MDQTASQSIKLPAENNIEFSTSGVPEQCIKGGPGFPGSANSFIAIFFNELEIAAFSQLTEIEELHADGLAT